MNAKGLKIGLGLLAAVFFAAGALLAKDGGTYYTNFNIWYEKPMKILSTNYHKGAMLPIGTEVEILKNKKDEIEFRDKQTGTKFRIVLAEKYTPLSGEEFLNRYFSQENILKSAKYRGFSEMEKENIQSGTLREGMSRDAVIAAYGYPPTHRTPSLKDAVWTYWRSRYVDFMIQFRDGKLVMING